MDQRPRPCWNVASVLAPFVGIACALLAGVLRGGHPMSGLKVGVMALGVFLILGFVSACVALVRSERLWGVTALGMALNSPFVLIAVAAPWDWPF
jgi:hypothetical protein